PDAGHAHSLGTAGQRLRRREAQPPGRREAAVRRGGRENAAASAPGHAVAAVFRPGRELGAEGVFELRRQADGGTGGPLARPARTVPPAGFALTRLERAGSLPPPVNRPSPAPEGTV